MEWMQFIVVGLTLSFMIPFILWNFLLIYCVEDESPGYALVVTLAFMVLIQACSNFSFPQWIQLNVGNLVKWGLIYIAIGVVYSIIKYILYLTDKRRKFDREFNKFKSKNDINSNITIDNLPSIHKRACFEDMRWNRLPDLYSSTRNIVFWIGYWPWSAFWTLLNNPLKWLFEEIKEMLSGMFKGLHKRILGSRRDAFKDWEEGDKNYNKDRK